MSGVRDGLRLHGRARFTVRDRRGRIVQRVVGENLETQWALNSVAAWIAAGSPLVVVPAGPGYLALGTGPQNLLTAEQASFETGTAGWAAVSNCTIGQSSTEAWNGTYSMSVTASSSGSVTAGTLTGTSAVAVTQGDGVEAYSYCGSAHFYAGSTARTVTVAIVWYNSAGTVLSTSTGTGVSDSTSAWVRAYVYAAAPTSAAHASIQVAVAGCGSSETHYVDGVQLAYAPDGPYAWAAGQTSAVPGISDTNLIQERAATRVQVQQSASQQSYAILVATYQPTTTYGMFSEAGLFDAAAGSAATSGVTAAGASSVTLAAGAPAVVAGQPIYIATDPLTPPAAPTFGSASATGGYLVGGTTYYYVITATNSLGQSTVGAEAHYEPATTTATNQITLTWAAVTGATGYDIYRGTSSGTEQYLASVSSATYVDDTNTTPSGAQPTVDTSGGGGEYAVVSTAAAAGAGSWQLTDFLLRSHPSGAAVTVFNGNMWAHTTYDVQTETGYGMTGTVTQTSEQYLTANWEVEVSN